MTIDTSDCSACLGHFQTLVVVTLLFIGYILQFMTSFRRDRGIANSNFFSASNVNSSEDLYSAGHKPFVTTQYYRPIALVGDTVFVYVVPGILHFCGFSTALYAFRVVDNEHLQNLVERVGTYKYKLFCNFFNYIFYYIGIYISLSTY